MSVNQGWAAGGGMGGDSPPHFGGGGEWYLSIYLPTDRPTQIYLSIGENLPRGGYFAPLKGQNDQKSLKNRHFWRFFAKFQRFYPPLSPPAKILVKSITFSANFFLIPPPIFRGWGGFFWAQKFPPPIYLFLGNFAAQPWERP